jgi:hypothetical protein
MREDPNAWDGTPDRFTSFSREQALAFAGATVLGTGAVMVWQVGREGGREGGGMGGGEGGRGGGESSEGSNIGKREKE